MSKIPFAQLFRGANPDALDLLDRMLAFDPSQRITVEEALEHRYLSIWHDASDEPNCPTTFDFAFEAVDEVPDMRAMILDEVRRFRHQVRAPQYSQHAQHAQPQEPVPIPNGGYETRSYEDPRPQEMQAGMMPNDLEEELRRG